MKENRNTSSRVRSFFSDLFMDPSSLPPFLEYFVTLFEFFTFTIFISSNSDINSLIFAPVIQRNVTIFLIALFVLRYLTRITLIKSIYVMVIVWNIQCSFGIMSIVVYGLLLVHVAIDMASKIEFSFETKNLHSSTYPWFIVLHYLLVGSITVLRYLNFSQNFIFPLCEVIAFALLILVQSRALMKYEQFKSLHQRFYFLCCMYAIAEFYQAFISKQPFWKTVFAISVSQLLYQFIQWKTKTEFTVEEYVSKKMEIEAGYFIFSFLYTKKPITKAIAKALRTLSNEDNNCLIEEKTFKESMMNTKRATGENFLSVSANQTKDVSYKLMSALKENSSIYAHLFLSELALYELDQHIKCRQILTNLSRRTSCMTILSKILISKIEKKLLAHLKIEHDKCTTPNFYEFIQNDRFRNLLLKSALNFIDLWEYTKVKEGIYKRINELAEKVIRSQDKIQKSYENIKVKCIRINLLYGNYLFCVQRNNGLANQIMENLYFYQEKQANLQCDNKVYIKISINSKQPLRVSAVGSNINKHLGYEKRLVVGMNLNNFLPEFYKDFHDNKVTEVLQNQTQRLFLFTKSTVVKHARGSYVTALLCLRLTYDQQGELFLQGYMKINTDEKHNWHNYLFVKHASKEIVECSALVNDKISQGKGKKFNADQYFDNCERDFHKRIMKYTSDLNKYFYEPMISFESADDQVTMFVELDPYAQPIEHRVQNDKEGNRKILIPQMVVYPKYKVFNNIKHFLRKKISTKEILGSIKTRLVIFMMIMLLMIVGIFILQGINIKTLNDEFENKIETMVVTDNIVNHYMSLSKIGVDLSYLVVNELYGYEFPSFNVSLKESIMVVQKTNQYFKQYSISEWEYESKSAKQEYRTCYEFISEVLAAASFIDQIPNNVQIKENNIASYNELFTETFVWSYAEYTTRIQEQLSIKSQNRDLYQIIKIVVLFILSSVLYIFLIKLQNCSRVSEHETLKFIGSITFQDQIIEKAKDFIYLITQQKVENLSNSKSINYSTLNKDMNDGIKISEVSARESTGRDLMGNMSGRDTIRTAQNPFEKGNQIDTQQFPIKLRSANKLFIILPLILLIGIFALQLFNYILNVKMREINEAESSKNIVEWMNKPLFFTRLVNAFLTEDRGPEFLVHDNTFNKTYKYFQNSYNSIASFDEINYDQFSEFEQKLRKIRFEYLCTYAKCPDSDKDYVNILYTTAMQKLAGYMLANHYFLDDPNNKMDTIMISEQLFREIMIDLIQTYIKNYKEYAYNYKNNQLLFIIIIIGVLTLMFVVMGLQVYFNVFKSLFKHFKICNIVKEESYLINKEALISFEQEQLQKQKMESKKKQTIKKNKDKDNPSEISENKSNIIEENEGTKGSKFNNGDSPKLKRNQNERKLSIFKELQKNKNK